MLVRAWMGNPAAAGGAIRPRGDAMLAQPCLVDLASKRVEWLHDHRSGRLIAVEVVDDVSCGGWLPMELLILEP